MGAGTQDQHRKDKSDKDQWKEPNNGRDIEDVDDFTYFGAEVYKEGGGMKEARPG